MAAKASKKRIKKVKIKQPTPPVNQPSLIDQLEQLQKSAEARITAIDSEIAKLNIERLALKKVFPDHGIPSLKTG